MKINVLRLIEDALIGGKNGEMAFIENNPMIANLYREYTNSSEDKTFKGFLLACINEEDSNVNEMMDYKYDVIKKSYRLDKCYKEFNEYEKIGSEIQALQRKKEDKLDEIATMLNPQLVDISTYEIKYREYSTDLQFKINVKLLKAK